MAASLARDDEDGITSINITPLVDVFLVLLILVMITSSLLDHREIPVSVPMAANAGDKAPEASGVAIDSTGKVYLDGVAADSASLDRALRDKVAADPAHQVLVAAHRGLPFEEVTHLLDLVRGAGVRKYAFKVARRE
jgi:biopolymer transport protein TolR